MKNTLFNRYNNIGNELVSGDSKTQTIDVTEHNKNSNKKYECYLVKMSQHPKN